MGLLEKLQSALPLYAKPTAYLLKFIRKKGLRIQPGQELKISNVYDSGEMGGIVCAVEGDREVFVISIMHLDFSEDTPYYDEIVSYQNLRRQGLLRQAIQSETKVGRNDPCPCGSGKKYKNCCLV